MSFRLLRHRIRGVAGKLPWLVWLLALASANGAPVNHRPRFPKSGEVVQVTVESPAGGASGSLALEYQVVEPGAYVSRDSPEYSQRWKRLPLAPGAQGQLVAQVPAEVQAHRRLVRFRIVEAESGRPRYPKPDAAEPNYAWFVYDGIPAWTGAIRPSGSGLERKPLTIPAPAMRRVQAYHLVTRADWVKQSQWTEPSHFGDEEARRAYRWTGALVSDDGTVYDHVRYRPRGGQWRHAMGKNMWKFDFNSGHRFEARDDFGRPYRSTWGKLNLGACFQQGDYGMRGEQGLFESVGFRLFDLAGVAAPRTHFVQLRTVTGAEETGPTQYDGDFFGLYLATENVDGAFLTEHGLSSQSVFKMDFGTPSVAHDGKDGLGVRSVSQFLGALGGPRDEAWWRSTIDVPGYFNYRSIVDCIHHYDIGSGKNYFYRRDPSLKRWTVVPWDLDLTWSEHMFGDGSEPFLVAGILQHPGIQKEFRNRLGEILQLLFTEEETGALIDEMAAVVADPASDATLAEADRRQWDWHPILSTGHVQSFKSTPGSFYRASPTRNFQGMRKAMKDFVDTRRETVALMHEVPKSLTETPRRVSPVPAGSGSIFRSRAPAGSRIEWRLADVTRGTIGTIRTPNSYEILPVWTTNGVSEVGIPPEVLRAGRKYRLRARTLEASGVAALWSEPVELSR